MKGGKQERVSGKLRERISQEAENEHQGQMVLTGQRRNGKCHLDLSSWELLVTWVRVVSAEKAGVSWIWGNKVEILCEGYYLEKLDKPERIDPLSYLGQVCFV